MQDYGALASSDRRWEPSHLDNLAFAIRSGERTLLVACREDLRAWWPEIVGQLPGVPATAGLSLRLPGSQVDLYMDTAHSADPVADARRVIAAGLHRLHLGHDTLCPHAVALVNPERTQAVVLLGGHSAGKTLVSIAMSQRDWLVAAGDVALLDVPAARGIAVRGGTRAVWARRRAIRRWFPEFGVIAAGSSKLDLSATVTVVELSRPVPVIAAVLVDVDGDPAGADAELEGIDHHTATTMWLRCSAHLLDRMMPAPRPVLRLFEDERDLRRRMHLIKVLVTQLPAHAAWGAPHGIARRIVDLATAHSAATRGPR